MGEDTQSPPYTAAQLEAGIANALAAHDVEAVMDILGVLAVVDIRRAGLVLDTIKLGLAMRESAR